MISKKILLIAVLTAVMALAQEALCEEVTGETNSREALARELFSPLSFDIADYFYVQNDLRRYIAKIEVKGSMWDELRQLHEKSDYLGMLGVLKGEKLREYPSESTIRQLHSKLMNASMYYGVKYDLSLSTTHDINVGCFALPNKSTKAFLMPGRRNFSFSFFMADGRVSYICSPDDKYRHIVDLYAKELGQVEEDIKLARVFKDEGEAKLVELKNKEAEEILHWLKNSKVRVGEAKKDTRPVPLSFWKNFDADAEDSSKAGEKAERTNLDGGVCSKCKGRGVVQSEKYCDKCNGTGTRVVKSRIKDMSGKPIPPKTIKCDRCRGTGVVKGRAFKCTACKGKGKRE